MTPEVVFNFLAGIIGAAVGGIFVLAGTWLTIRAESKRDQAREEKEVQNLLDALGVEIKTLWDFHMKRVGQQLESLPENKAFEFYYPLTQDYFTIYNSNAALIGRIKDCELSEAIVVCYNKCKKAVDGFKYNNALYEAYTEAMNKHLEPEITISRNKFQGYAATLKEDHFELKGYVKRLLEMLKA